VKGLQWSRVVPGAVLSVGPHVRLEITKYTTPCDTIRESFVEHDISRISQKRHPGWSRVCARVLRPGVVSVGDAVVLE
jgi:MOSC domain-containing protein YiiM